MARSARLAARQRRHRRSGRALNTWTPNSLAGLLAAGRASTLSYADGDPVSLVPAAYGSARSFTSAGANRPTFKANQTPAGGPALLFATSLLTFSAATPALSAWHLFIVLKHTATAGNQAYLGGPSSPWGTVFSDSAASDQCLDDGINAGFLTYGGSPKDTTTFHVVEVYCDTTTIGRRRDGTLLDTSPSTVGPWTFGTLGNWLALTGPLKAYVAEWELYNAVQSGVNAALVRDYLKTLYGTP